MTRLFLKATRERFLDEYLPRLRRAVTALPPADLWWRPHAECTAVGTLLLHLEGNVRQWLLSGLGGELDERQRATEFAADGSAPEQAAAAPLLAALEATVGRACALLDELDERTLEESVTIQGFEVTRLEAIYHVLEHFGWHTGQITWIAKMRAGAAHGIQFYDERRINEARNPVPPAP